MSDPKRELMFLILLGITFVVLLTWSLGYFDATPANSDLERIGYEIPQP